METTAGSQLPGAQPDEPSGPDGGEPTDGQLVRGTLAGARRDFDTLVVRYQKQAVAVSYRLLGSTHDALEVVQDSFLKAFTSLGTLQRPEAFGGWFLRIVSNLSLNYRRSRKIRAQLPLDDLFGTRQPDGSPQTAATGETGGGNIDPLRSAAGKELGGRLMSALAELPEKQRLALVLFTIEQMPQKEVAAALECSVEAVKWHVFQGRKRLKELLKDYL
jgi:RNA polymerase sigma-70 factor (ECF subfamily)